MAVEVIALVKDFQAGTRIADVVSTLERKIVFPESAAGLDDVLSEETCLVIIDLDEESFGPLELVKRIRAGNPNLSVVGFYSRIRKDAYVRAREAGCTWVFTGSSLVKNLPTLLKEARKEQAGDRN